ncbi:MAG: PQQ-like beta-propeller repeat protein [Opitutae bacterium]|nr:PQQ-like beta-propeller repeat protein [Opitutae bacterium]
MLILLIVSSPCYGETWNQWRGTERNGQAQVKIQLHNQWPKEGPALLWESDEIPSQDYGGFGSIIAGKKNAYISLVWHKDVPTQTRTISDLVLRKLGVRKINLPPEIINKAEADRLSLSPRLRGTKLQDWIDHWIQKNLSIKQAMSLGDLLASRFKKGKLALPISTINRMHEIKNKVFPSQNALDQWLDKENFGDEIKEKISQGVPPTKQVAEDVVVALDLNTGTVVWKTSLESLPTGRKSSSTPCLSNGKIYAVGSERIYCIDSNTGKLIWDQKLPTTEIASSILSFKKSVIVLAGNLRAYDQKNGKLLWENNSVKGKTASPSIWKTNEQEFIVCNSSKTVVVINPDNGKTFWEGAGGGSSTPVCEKDLMIVHGKQEDVGLIAYKFTTNEIIELWRIPKLTRRTDSSPLIKDGFAYLIGAGMRMCVNLQSGKIIRKVTAKHDISSPILADGKILAYEINGSFLKMIDCDPNHFEEIQKAKINALKCTSPSLAGSKLLIRKEKKIVCLELGNFNSP